MDTKQITEQDAFIELRNGYVMGIAEYKMVLATLEDKKDEDTIAYQQVAGGDGDMPMQVPISVSKYKEQINTKIEQFEKLIILVDKKLHGKE